MLRNKNEKKKKVLPSCETSPTGFTLITFLTANPRALATQTATSGLIYHDASVSRCAELLPRLGHAAELQLFNIPQHKGLEQSSFSLLRQPNSSAHAQTNRSNNSPRTIFSQSQPLTHNIKGSPVCLFVCSLENP